MVLFYFYEKLNPAAHILYTLDLANITSKFHTSAMFVTINLQTVNHT